MNPSKKAALAVAACSMVTLLAACGAAADPQGGNPPSAPAAPASAGTTAATPAVASPTPSADPSRAAPQVKAASEKFIKIAFTIGYPDQTADDYFDRVEPLTTKRGLAQLEKDLDHLDSKEAKQAFAQRIRITTKATSGVKVTAIDGTEASTQAGYRLLRQQQSGGKWKTLKTDDEKNTLKLTLVNDDGTWLVDSAK